MDAEPLWQIQKREALRKKKEAQRRAKVKDQRWHQFNLLVDTSSGRSMPEQIVLFQLFRRADKVGRVDMSVRQVASNCGVSKTTVQEAIESLRKVGVLRVLSKGTNRTPPTMLIDFQKLTFPPS